MRIRCVTSPYRITQKYGYDPTYPLNGGWHYGTDYVTDNRMILAPQNGTVTAIGKDATNGNYLVIEGNGYRDWFSHIRDGGYKVSQGQAVAQGQHVADMGTTGASTGIHVHHSLRKDGVRVDPEAHITAQGGQIMDTEAKVRAQYYTLRGSEGTSAEVKSWVGKSYEQFNAVARPEVDSREAHKRNLESAVANLTRERDEARAQVASLTSQLASTQDQITKLTAELTESQAQYQGSVEAYKQLEAQHKAQIEELNRVIEIKDNEIKRLTTELANCGGESLTWSQHLVLGIKGLLNALNPLSK
jgi:septal ring factor EnvC (AmiA/AmiB activator)